MPDFGQYADEVKFVKDFADVYNPSEKKKNKAKCWVDVERDCKQWNEVDLKTIAVNACSYPAFQKLMILAQASVSDNASDAVCAQNALAELAPKGKTWAEFQNMIITTIEQNTKAIQKANFEVERLLVANSYVEIRGLMGLKDGEYKTLSIGELRAIANDPKRDGIFKRLVFIASFGDNTDAMGVILDANGKPAVNEDGSPKYTAVARYRQKALKAFAPDGDVATFYTNIETVMDEVRAKKGMAPYRASKGKGPSADEMDGGSLGLDGLEMVQMLRIDSPAFDQQKALEILTKGGVKMEASHEVKTPNFSEEALKAVAGIKKSVSLAA